MRIPAGCFRRMRATVLAIAGTLLGACASYDVHSLFFTSHTSRETYIPGLHPEPWPDTPYVENGTWMLEGQYFRLDLSHDTSLVGGLHLSAIPAVGETLLVSDTSKSYLWVGRGIGSSQRGGRVVGIPYVDSSGQLEAQVRRNPKGLTIVGRWAVRYRLDWNDPTGRANWVQGEAHILQTRYRTRDKILD